MSETWPQMPIGKMGMAQKHDDSEKILGPTSPKTPFAWVYEGSRVIGVFEEISKSAGRGGGRSRYGILRANRISYWWPLAKPRGPRRGSIFGIAPVVKLRPS
ncbi:hypothetical protein RRG08_066761 [Elysia crispata]|uniref:Uncharacterized protein n=1 Tax=Elysia crispata TaxID=231223 RepID=A0AAE1CKB4_9GAST|nr:hypothetical protein RRG08_066761 [Elysia crispata]